MIYHFRDMAGNITTISLDDGVNRDANLFIKDFMKECKKLYPELKYNNLKIFDKDRRIYMFDFIPEDGYIFDIFIKDEDDGDILNYYKNIWRGNPYNTYIISTEKNKNKNTYNFMCVYCGSCSNLLMSAINENLDDFWNRCGDFLFADQRSRLEYMYETLS